jgi:hypothetical protein
MHTDELFSNEPAWWDAAHEQLLLDDIVLMGPAAVC